VRRIGAAAKYSMELRRQEAFLPRGSSEEDGAEISRAAKRLDPTDWVLCSACGFGMPLASAKVQFCWLSHWLKSVGGLTIIYLTQLRR